MSDSLNVDMPRASAQHCKLALVLALSLLVHAMLLLWPVKYDPVPRQPGTNRISLVAPPPRPAPTLSESPAIESPSPDDTTAPSEITPADTSETRPPPDEASSEPAERHTPDATEIRAQALRLAGERATDNDDEGDSSTLSFRAVPRLPGATGWMDQHVGTVTASREHWRSADGGLHSRIVATNGRVVCASIRPPTMQEFFNPWMSSAVPMLRSCGRERPPPADNNDPWHRRAGD